MNEEKQKKFINSEAKKLAKELHKEEHIIINKKIEDNHKLEDWYYLMASGIYNKLIDKIETRLGKDDLNLIIQEINKLKDELKEVSKQQKYLWQTLGEIFDKPIKLQKLKEKKE